MGCQRRRSTTRMWLAHVSPHRHATSLQEFRDSRRSAQLWNTYTVSPKDDGMTMEATFFSSYPSQNFHYTERQRNRCPSAVLYSTLRPCLIFDPESV